MYKEIENIGKISYANRDLSRITGIPESTIRKCNNELASLNDDISPDLIDQLQAKLSNDAISFSEEDNASNTPANPKDDATLFEETENQGKPKSDVKKIEVNLDKKFDDNFIKKYKAKLNKQQEAVNKDSKKE